ncbi:hypothetical protein BCON_0014g00630 [Botryotinia convoluta]|uniref:Uncharacterized protein n=1 Tax=Botryotinia convoluta TaxID=54673 RepID=A0A4Z1IRG8_9HELO|nr:hypothetical protein BCON_0014g00630 [Botryotinia convoluta]
MSDPESHHRSPTQPRALRRRGHQTLRRNSDRHSYAGLDRTPHFLDHLNPPRNNELNWNRRGNSPNSDIDVRRAEELVHEQLGTANFTLFPRNEVVTTKGDLDYKKLEKLGATFPKIYQQCIDCAIFKMKFVRASGSDFDYNACNLLELEMAEELNKESSTAEWKTLYNHLASQKRVSDMRDLFHIMSESDVMSAIHGWVTDEPLIRSDDLLELGLNTARELGNFSLEGKFLEEIILGSQEPLELLRERARLQKDVQGYRQGYLATCLTRYLVASNETMQRELYDDLSNFDDEEIGFPEDRGDAIILKCCYNRIQRALCISFRGTKDQLDIHTRKEVFLHKKVSENHPELFESNMRAMAVNEQNDSSLRIGRNHNDISYLWYEKSSVAKDERYWENRPRRMFESINSDKIEPSGEEI